MQLDMHGQGPHDSVQTMGLPENTRNATLASVVRMHNTGDHNEQLMWLDKNWAPTCKQHWATGTSPY